MVTRTLVAKRIAGVLLLLSGVFSAVVLVNTVWVNAGFFTRDPGLILEYPFVSDFWIPLAGSIVSLTFITLGFMAVFRGRNWPIAVVGAIFTLLTPIVWRLWPVAREPSVSIARETAVVVGVAAIILTLVSRRAFLGHAKA